MKITKLSTLFPLLLGIGHLLSACANQPAKATPVTHRASAPVASDGRNYDLHAEDWETLPPYAQPNDRAE
jgi:hypothetical protein